MNFHESFHRELAILDRQETPVRAGTLAQRATLAINAKRRGRRRLLAATSVAVMTATALLLTGRVGPTPSGPRIVREAPTALKLPKVKQSPSESATVAAPPPGKPAPEHHQGSTVGQTDEQRPAPASLQPPSREAGGPATQPRQTIASAPTPRAEDLLAQALKKRSAGDVAKGNELLKQLRAEHRESPQATVAAMYLARDAARSGRSAEARRLFEATAKQQPGGPLEREALGRLLELSEGEKKVEVARRYLVLHSNGPHAAMARRAIEEEN